jgi:hypothetical protein
LHPTLGVGADNSSKEAERRRGSVLREGGIGMMLGVRMQELVQERGGWRESAVMVRGWGCPSYQGRGNQGRGN